jgi:hypothetical protein
MSEFVYIGGFLDTVELQATVEITPKPIFREGQAVRLKLAATKIFSNIVKITYEPQY